MNKSPSVKGAPAKKRIGREVYDTLTSLLAEVPETPTTHLGVFVANSTKREIRKQIDGLFEP